MLNVSLHSRPGFGDGLHFYYQPQCSVIFLTFDLKVPIILFQTHQRQSCSVRLARGLIEADEAASTVT